VARVLLVVLLVRVVLAAEEMERTVIRQAALVLRTQAAAAAVAVFQAQMAGVAVLVVPVLSLFVSPAPCP